jgi:nucleoside-diphosphate-sugar epimerase
LKSSCFYFDDKNGLFHPLTPTPRFIVTGGAGFIGSYLVKSLRMQGITSDQIKVIDNLWRGYLGNLQFENGSWAVDPLFDFCLMDLRNSEETSKYLRGADYVYHLADIVAGVDYVFDHQSAVFRDNILINSNALHASKENGIQNYIYVSTACSFPQHLQMGPGIHALHEHQTYPAHPESAYGWSKLMGEYEAELARNPGKFNVGLLRFHNVYDSRSDSTTISGQGIPSLIRKAVEYPRTKYVVWGSGSQYRDFIHVSDVVEALLKVRVTGMNQGVVECTSKIILGF